MSWLILIFFIINVRIINLQYPSMSDVLDVKLHIEDTNYISKCNIMILYLFWWGQYEHEGFDHVGL